MKVKKQRAPEPEPVTAQYSQITIKGFRRFRNLALQGFGRVNLFFGRNNSGKSTILEALYTHACGPNLGPFLSQVVGRRQDNLFSGPLDFGERLTAIFADSHSLPYQFDLVAIFEGSQRRSRVNVTFRPSSALAGLGPRVLGEAVDTIRQLPLLEESETSSTLISPRSTEPKTVAPREATYIGQWMRRCPDRC